MRKTDFEFPSLYRRRLAASTDNGPLPQSFTDIPSSTDPSEPEGFISSFRVRSNIRNATVLDLHHIGAVGKFYGPADCRQKRDWPEDQWLTDFRREQRMYELSCGHFADRSSRAILAPSTLWTITRVLASSCWRMLANG
jgi:hypothetical protein